MALSNQVGVTGVGILNVSALTSTIYYCEQNTIYIQLFGDEFNFFQILKIVALEQYIYEQGK